MTSIVSAIPPAGSGGAPAPTVTPVYASTVATPVVPPPGAVAPCSADDCALRPLRPPRIPALFGRQPRLRLRLRIPGRCRSRRCRPLLAPPPRIPGLLKLRAFHRRLRGPTQGGAADGHGQDGPEGEEIEDFDPETMEVEDFDPDTMEEGRAGEVVEDWNPDMEEVEGRRGRWLRIGTEHGCGGREWGWD